MTGMVAGGNPPMRADQAIQLPGSRAGSGPAPQNTTFIGRLVIIFGSGPNTGLFVYNGQPGPGNPSVAWESTAATDPYGNVLPAAGALGLNGLPFLSYAKLTGFTTQTLTGSGTWVAPAGVTQVRAQCWAAGTNGAAGTAGIGSAGGAGGEYAEEPALAVTPGNSYAFSVPAGGSATSCTFAGDTTTVVAHGGTFPGGLSPGRGGTGSTNTIHNNGGNGGAELNSATGGSGGGASGGYFAAGNPGRANTGGSAGSAGGAAVTGGSSGGNGGNAGSAGGGGGTPGGGGGGGGSGVGGPGLGAAGMIVLSYSASSQNPSVLASVSGSQITDALGNTIPAGFTTDKWALLIPTGDTSGISDFANINGALTAGYAVQLMPGTYFLNQLLEIPGNGVVLGTGKLSTIIQAVGALSAVMATKGWAGSTNTGSVAPWNLAGFTVDGNNAATYGIVSQNFWSNTQEIEIRNCVSDGLRFDHFGANGTTALTGTAVENYVRRVEVRACGGRGIASTDPAANPVFTDGFLIDCIVQDTAGTDAIFLSQAPGWLIEGCHVYGLIPGNGIKLQRMFNTRVVNNYVETWGQSATAGTYQGISGVFAADNGDGSVISGNVVRQTANAGNAGSTIDGISFQSAGGNTGTCIMTGNSAALGAGLTARSAFHFTNQNNTATTVGIFDNNIATGPWTNTELEEPNGGTMTIAGGSWHNLGAPIAGWAVGGGGRARYKLLSDSGLVLLEFANITLPGAPPADGTIIWTAANGLPAGYQPAIGGLRQPMYGSSAIGTEIPAFQVGTDGSIQVFGVGGTTISRMDGSFTVSTI